VLRQLTESCTYQVDVVQCLPDDLDTLLEISLLNDQWRSKPDSRRMKHVNEISLRGKHMKPYTLTWVGFASTPLLFNKRQNCQAVRPRLLFDWSITIAFNNPRPLTSLTSGELNARTPERNFSPSISARSDRRSSIRMSRAVVAIAHPNGFLWLAWSVRRQRQPYVKSFLPSVCTSMFSGLDAEHDVLVSQHSRYGVH